MQRDPSTSDNGVLRPAPTSCSVLPAINRNTTTNITRVVSPNVLKRVVWLPPRENSEEGKDQQQHEIFVSTATEKEDDGAIALVSTYDQGSTRQVASTSVVPLEHALEVLQAIMDETDDCSDSARQREAALNDIKQLQETEECELEQTRLATNEQLQTTLKLLQTELARERRWRSTNEESRAGTTAVAPAMTRNKPSKQQTARLAPRLRNSPLKPRTKVLVEAQREHKDIREEGVRLELFENDSHADTLDFDSSMREIKLRELREERGRWQREYEVMREQVIEEKARQVTLFQRLEAVRQSYTSQLKKAEAALHTSQADVERLQARLVQTRINAAHEARRAAAHVQSSLLERQRLVCALAETRHKFREWKEGEAATLRATREQAVHALRTEYELKLARHQEEKQKLRDKVKDLEVSLRLLQQDRQSSPGQLSARKGTLLHNTVSSIGFGDVGAADFIEAQGRIRELEALLLLSNQRHERQDALLRVSETAFARLCQERELDALEKLLLPSPAVTLALSSREETQIMGEDNKQSIPGTSTSVPVELPTTTARVVKSAKAVVTVPVPVSPSTPSSSPTRREVVSGGDIRTDLEKDASADLSVEASRYEEIGDMPKESEQRNENDRIDGAITGVSSREAYLLKELAASRREIDAMKAILERKSMSDGKPLREKIDGEDIESEAGKADLSNSDAKELDDFVAQCVTPFAISTSQDRAPLIKEQQHDENKSVDKELVQTDAAVKVIQTCSKGFFARREFIRKKLAIEKIKARYRGYLVRKSREALRGCRLSSDRKFVSLGLASQPASDFVRVSEGLQYKMQIVDPHCRASYDCEGGGNSRVEVELRVSKDPPILQLQVLPTTVNSTGFRAVYFHLFETIALLSCNDEERVLGTSSEKEIARIFASRLVVQHKGSSNDFSFFITRPNQQQRDSVGSNKEDLVLGRGFRTLLTELPVQPIAKRATSLPTGALDSSFDGTTSVLHQEADLDLLIREARVDPLNNKAVHSSSMKGTVVEILTTRM